MAETVACPTVHVSLMFPSSLVIEQASQPVKANELGAEVPWTLPGHRICLQLQGSPALCSPFTELGRPHTEKESLDCRVTPEDGHPEDMQWNPMYENFC